MKVTIHPWTRPITVGVAFAAVLGAGVVEQSMAQGCEPIRFSAASLGGVGGPNQKAHEWRLTLGYRHLYSNQFFLGTTDVSSQGPGHASPMIEIHSFVADLGYSVSDRVTVRLAVPFSTGTHGRYWPGGAWHEQKATGFGDITLSADSWILEPSTHQSGNFSLGLGVLAPTGAHAVESEFFVASGPIPFPADMSIEPGSGGWGFTAQTSGFVKLFNRGYGYLSGSYTFAPQDSIANINAPLSAPAPTPVGFHWAVADGYSARLGLAYTAIPRAGLSLSLGGRIDGTPVRDVFGGGATALRRPGYAIYAEPGLSVGRGANSLTLSVPLRVKVNRIRSVLEQTNPAFDPAVFLAAGGFAKSLVFFSYSRRL